MLGCLPLLQAGVSASMEFRDGGVIIEPCPSTVRDQQVRARASDQQFDKAKGIAEGHVTKPGYQDLSPGLLSARCVLGNA